MMDFENDVDFEKLINKINEDIKKELSEKRYNHSVGVMNKAVELAKIYGVNVNKAKLVGLAHDIGKELSREDKIKYMDENELEIDEIERVNVGLLHAKIGADICKKRYGFTQDMQDAIKYHTVANENMDLLAKILFVADKIEDNRNYKDEKKMQNLMGMRELAKENLDKAVLYEIDASMEFTLQKKELIHLDSIRTRNRIIMECGMY